MDKGGIFMADDEQRRLRAQCSHPAGSFVPFLDGRHRRKFCAGAIRAAGARCGVSGDQE